MVIVIKKTPPEPGGLVGVYGQPLGLMQDMKRASLFPLNIEQIHQDLQKKS